MTTSLFAYAFRPHFLLVGLGGLCLIPFWTFVYVNHSPLVGGLPPSLWHAHEMLFGLVNAAIAGFLLTSVASWTGRKGFGGWPLIVMSALWVAARLLLASPVHGLAVAGVVVDLAFLPALAALIAPPLLRENNRNTPLLAVVALLWLCNVAFFWTVATGHLQLASRALVLTIDAIMILITVIGGRIVPAFTRTALRPAGREGIVRSAPGLRVAAIGAMIVVTLSDLVMPDYRLTGVVAAIAAGIHAIRLSQWGSLRTLRQPLVWVVHVAYAWLPVGLALKAFSLLADGPGNQYWVHALTVGTFSMMIMGVMTRTALGHTGRPMTAHPLTTVSYVLLLLAAVMRVFGPTVFGLRFNSAIVVSAVLWTGAFALFLVIYLPILTRPRADGRPG
ncbi:MAG: NnrS family protein [Gammaproteobacteria bacterium]